ncbi:hypothetical protein KSF78_0006406 [Schistosoma japonicum]|nr:hypothetical protein KSF78_0006406 [Schistosoma japonicum]
MQNYFLSVFILSICSFHDIYVFLISLHTFIFQLTALVYAGNNCLQNIGCNMFIRLLSLSLHLNFLVREVYHQVIIISGISSWLLSNLFLMVSLIYILQTSVSLKFSSNNVYSDLKFLQIALLYLKLKNNFLTLHIYT